MKISNSSGIIPSPSFYMSLHKTKLIPSVCFGVLMFCSLPSFGFLLTAVGCADDAPCDGNPDPGIILIGPGIGAFSGTVTETETPTSYQIIVSPSTLSAPGGLAIFSGHHGAFNGEGRLRAGITAFLEVVPPFVPLVTSGTERIGVSNFDDSFNNNSPVTEGTAPPGLALPFFLQGEDIHFGEYNGDGIMTARLQWAGLAVDVPGGPGVPRVPGEQFFLPFSAEYIAVPEPSTLILVGVSLLGLCFCRKATARQ